MTNSIAPLFFIIPVMFVITYFLIYKICKSPISAFIYAVFIAVLLIIILQYVGFATPMPLSLGILLVVIIVFAALFLGGAYNHYNVNYVDIDRLQTIPDDFVLLTEEELDRFPVINQAIASQKMTKVKPDEWNSLRNFLYQHDTDNIKVGNAYYVVLFATA